MNRARRFVALLLQLLLVHASVLGGGMACATDGDAAGSASVGSAHHAMHDMAAPNAPDAPRPLHGGTHSGTHGGIHCLTTAGCAALAVPAPTLADAPVATLVVRAEPLDARMPAAVRPAPETPPPRG